MVNKAVNSRLKTNVDFSAFIRVLLGLLLISQIGVLFYFNLFQMKDHIGFDSSWMFLKVYLMKQEHCLFTGPWIEQTNLFLDSSMLFASLLYFATGRLFESFAVSNLTILALNLICLNSIIKKLDIGLTSRLFALNLLISPYLINGYNLEFPYYTDCFLTGAAVYNLRGLTVLLIIREFILIRKTGKMDFLAWVSLALCFWSGISCGIYHLVVIILPCLVYIIYFKVLKDNKISNLKSKESLYAYILSIGVLTGKLVGSKFLGVQMFDATRTWTSLTELTENAAAPILGFMKLIGVLPVAQTDVYIMTVDGLTQLFPMFIFAVMATGLIYSFKYVIKNKADERHGIILMLLTVVTVNYVMFTLFNVDYGSYVFEERYLISTFMIVLVLTAIYLDHMDINNLLTKAVYCGLLISVFANTSISDIYYSRITNSYLQPEAITEAIEGEDAELIYVYGNELRTLERVLRTYDLDHIYKSVSDDGTYYHWGDYLYYEDNQDYSGPTLLIVSREGSMVPDTVLDQYTLIQDFETVSIYRADTNPEVGVYNPETANT